MNRELRGKLGRTALRKCPRRVRPRPFYEGLTSQRQPGWIPGPGTGPFYGNRGCADESQSGGPAMARLPRWALSMSSPKRGAGDVTAEEAM